MRIERNQLKAQLIKKSESYNYEEPAGDQIEKFERIFIEDAAPNDAQLHGEWKLLDYPVFSGSKSFVRTGVGNNQHFFLNSKNPHEIITEDDEFFAYAFLDPQNPPKQVMPIQRWKLGPSCLLG